MNFIWGLIGGTLFWVIFRYLPACREEREWEERLAAMRRRNDEMARLRRKLYGAPD